MKENPIKYLIQLIKPYKIQIILIFILNIATNWLNILIPKLIWKVIDEYQNNLISTFSIILQERLWIFLAISFWVFIFSVLLQYVSNYTTEHLAQSLRQNIINHISKQSFNYVSNKTPAKLQTIVTSDVETIKTIISMNLVYLLSAFIILIWSCYFLFSIDVKLSLIVLIMIPLLVLVFIVLFGKIKHFFKTYQEILEKLNKTISENIVWAALIKILNSQQIEINKFDENNAALKTQWINIAKMFSLLIPCIILLSNFSILAVVRFGGIDINQWKLTLGELSAFISYVNLLIMPIFILWFVFGNFSRAFISLQRVKEVFDTNDEPTLNSHTKNLIINKLQWDIEFENISLIINEKYILKDINFKINKGSRTAILWATWAGKTQLFLLLAWLIRPNQWKILIDWHEISEYDPEIFYNSLWLVFQDSIIFNTTLEENIRFKANVSTQDMQKAIKTAQLENLISTLPDWLQTQLSERWTNISWWQKQRLSLARALAINPTILMLDDFTARVDIKTEKNILKNLDENYPNITLLSISQKIDTIKDFDKIIFIMEGELLADWTHQELLNSCLEYKQIFESQQ